MNCVLAKYAAYKVCVLGFAPTNVTYKHKKKNDDNNNEITKTVQLNVFTEWNNIFEIRYET